MTYFTPFRPENYPRTYKHQIELAVYGYIMAGTGGFFAIVCLLIVAIKYHGDLAAGGACSAIGVIGLLALPIGLVRASAPRLILTADAIEYRNITSIYIATQRMRRDDIKGVDTVDYSTGSGRNSISSNGTTFLPREEKAPALFVPDWIFKLDDAYDAWVGGLPYLGGLYKRPADKERRFTAEDFPKVEWRDHKWLPRKE
jgi:hypothetical protein